MMLFCFTLAAIIIKDLAFSVKTALIAAYGNVEGEAKDINVVILEGIKPMRLAQKVRHGP